LSEPLPTHARAIVVGGGVIGTSTAYHLAKAGWSDILVLERDKLTSGSTWHAAGLIASSGMATETLAWIAKYTRELYQWLEAETGVSTGFHQCGHLHVRMRTKPNRPFWMLTCLTSAPMERFGVIA
jgi:4-methylaminobutanoate oxidase (formaldehyde-forming)